MNIHGLLQWLKEFTRTVLVEGWGFMRDRSMVKGCIP